MVGGLSPLSWGPLGRFASEYGAWKLPLGLASFIVNDLKGSKVEVKISSMT